MKNIFCFKPILDNLEEKILKKNWLFKNKFPLFMTLVCASIYLSIYLSIYKP